MQHKMRSQTLRARLISRGPWATCFRNQVFGPYWMMCSGLVRDLVDNGVTEQAATDEVLAFLQSESAFSVPYCEIASLLFAGMSTKIADEGQTKPANHGHWSDIEAIAAYLPYCHAICVDGYFEELMRKPFLAERLMKYETKVFSPGIRASFMSYLEGLEYETPSELRDVVIGVYGEGWLKPYEAILEYHRKRTAESDTH